MPPIFNKIVAYIRMAKTWRVKKASRTKTFKKRRDGLNVYGQKGGAPPAPAAPASTFRMGMTVTCKVSPTSKVVTDPFRVDQIAGNIVKGVQSGPHKLGYPSSSCKAIPAVAIGERVRCLSEVGGTLTKSDEFTVTSITGTTVKGKEPQHTRGYALTNCTIEMPKKSDRVTCMTPARTVTDPFTVGSVETGGTGAGLIIKGTKIPHISPGYPIKQCRKIPPIKVNDRVTCMNPDKSISAPFKVTKMDTTTVTDKNNKKYTKDTCRVVPPELRV